MFDYGDIHYQAEPGTTTVKNIHNMKDIVGFNKQVMSIQTDFNCFVKLVLEFNFFFPWQLSEAVCRIIKDGRMCLTLGGDHSIGLGTVHGHLSAQPETSLLWVDAHADINTPATSQSGNAHGMPVSFHIKELTDYQDQLPDFEWHTPMY